MARASKAPPSRPAAADLPPDLAEADRALGELALRYPETVEDHPWGHRAFKVRGKAFVFLSGEPGCLSISLKLPRSSTMALALPFASPTGYGLGKSGWITSTFRGDDEVPIALFAEWMRESFEAIAPKSLSRELDLVDAKKAGAKKPAAKKVGVKKAGAKKPAAKKPAAKKPAAKKAGAKKASAKKPDG